MKIPADAIIAEAKLRDYLLVYKDVDDKSLFLAQAGFTRDDPKFLEAALRQLIEAEEARLDRTDKFGTFYEVSGSLFGSHDRRLAVTTIWLQDKDIEQFRFITLIPGKRT